MRIPVRIAANGEKGFVVVEKPDPDGDVYYSSEDWGCYYDKTSALRVAKALIWAARKKVR